MVNDLIARIQIHIFSILVCLIMLVETQNHKDGKQFSFRLFGAQLMACILLLGSEAASWATTGSAKFFWNTVCFSLHAFPGYLFSLYADYQMGSTEEQLRRHRLIRLLPLLAAESLVCLNLFEPVLFSIDANGFYQREFLFTVDVLLSYSYLVYSFIRVYRNRQEMDLLIVRPLVFFHIIPVIGGIIQFCFYGSGFTLPSFALSLLICYIYIQNRQMGTDFLTNAYNRLQADKELRQRIQNQFQKSFSVIMLDINKFKSINDKFGHAVGDDALINTVQVLRQSLRSTDHLFRYGGDEFLVITDINGPEELDHIVDRIRHNFRLFNQQANKQFQLNLSIGYAIFDAEAKSTPEQLLAIADANMYRAKQDKSPASVPFISATEFAAAGINNENSGE